MKAHMKIALLLRRMLIFSLVSCNAAEPTRAPTPVTVIAGSRASETTVFVRATEPSAKPLESTVALSTAPASTKESAETTIKVHASTEEPASRFSTSGVQLSTKGKLKNARRQKLNKTSSALGGGGVRAKPQELGAIDCDLPVLPRESRLWRGNETHELNLPVTECGRGGGEECPPMVVSWEAAVDIQSGDILIVRIADSKLLENISQLETKNKSHETNWTKADGERVHQAPPQPAVYQVTRQGHEHCDVSDGMLLDITPLAERDAKLITLYDKDLTEGVNLLIVVSENWGYQCVRLKVTVKSDNCGEAQECSGKGVCYTNVSMEGYECQCCPGYVAPHCEERDACDPSPCLNNGICVDLTQPLNGLNFHCLCPYGFTGRNCEKDPCYSAPCLNGGSCMSMAMNGSTTFHCECGEGWTGARCELAAGGGACAHSPCVNGICVERTADDSDGHYRCFCEPGFTGDHCELEYNECASSPCANGGTCNDLVGGYACACGRGYTGNRCQLKVDLCSPNPCPSHRYCIDHGNTYSCECPRGYVGEDCSVPARAACDNNPCAHGGTCWNGVDSFYCSCRPGYTGRLCEEDFILESVVGGEGQEARRGAGAVGRGGVGAGGGGGGAGSVREVHLPLGLYHDRLHNVYIAAGTLGAAIAIVGVVVTACHCRVNKTYSRLLSRFSRRADSGPPHHWLEDKRPAQPAAAAAAHYPAAGALDTTDMYYTLDFSDSQSSPLIQ